MYSAVRSLTRKELLLLETPALASALVIAELFYKFHSFTLECVAFLGTWFLLSSLLSGLASLLPPRSSHD